MEKSLFEQSLKKNDQEFTIPEALAENESDSEELKQAKFMNTPPQKSKDAKPQSSKKFLSKSALRKDNTMKIP